ncbi:hypothetical protein FRC07_000361 [Ceratobasidium sp. 392]|nr:hypothetical protein FRC07_000361 [Ceratobasidium sp. 392]
MTLIILFNPGLNRKRFQIEEEWDRLNIAVSVITATSAAALAIQSTGSNPSQVYWLVTAFYSAAFGMSLQGLILITYITISAGGTSDEAIGRLARGELFKNQPVKPVAFTMALPAILATYSSFALLAGLGAMIMHGPGESASTKGGSYIVVAIVPVGITFVCLCFAVLFCEVGTWIERNGRRRAAEAAYLLSQSGPPNPVTTRP